MTTTKLTNNAITPLLTKITFYPVFYERSDGTFLYPSNHPEWGRRADRRRRWPESNPNMATDLQHRARCQNTGFLIQCEPQMFTIMLIYLATTKVDSRVHWDPCQEDQQSLDPLTMLTSHPQTTRKCRRELTQTEFQACDHPEEVRATSSSGVQMEHHMSASVRSCFPSRQSNSLHLPLITSLVPHSLHLVLTPFSPAAHPLRSTCLSGLHLQTGVQLKGQWPTPVPRDPSALGPTPVTRRRCGRLPTGNGSQPQRRRMTDRLWGTSYRLD
ncbi:hypothetical protein EYF80_013939 [Liparis tanakae]|uniref:Uncharacterized protein n=1 Tax=Liparis tanakae TaxID=230148 RepID=A0A4Z2IEP4_9TELE|nr:hypothetical protein EYF80_013939 [Liparis tanakae]